MLPEIIVKKIKFEISEIDTEISTYKPLLDLCKIKNPDIVEITALASVLHLLFNMTTGSGKIFIMAANILFLYKEGYRNFIFFHLTFIF